MMLRMRVLLLLGISLTVVNSESLADETSYASYSPAVYVVAGLLVVDVGVSLSNGFSLSRGDPNRLNGYFGLVTGTASLGLVAANLAMEDDEDLRNGFALMMGTAGTASLVLGVLNIKQARLASAETAEISKITVFPSLSAEKGQGYRIGVDVNITF
jgi:hypothetical membrane protein